LAEKAMSFVTVWSFRVTFAATLIFATHLALEPVVSPVITSWNDKVVHASGFIVLAFLADFSFPASRFRAAKYVPLFAYGVAIECLQYFAPPRSFSVADMLADAAGLAAYALLVPLLKFLPLLRRRWAPSSIDV
jgi:VanZ family protein